MGQLLLRITVASLIYGGWPLSLGGQLNANAMSPCPEEADQNPAKTKLLPIVRDRASLQKLSEKEVVVFGRYQRATQQEPLKLSTRELQDSPRSEIKKPLLVKDQQVHTSSMGQANIVLDDGTVLPISPRGRRSLRGKDELDKFNGQVISVQGLVRWNPQGFYQTEIDNITNLRRICSVSKSPSKMMNADEWQGQKLAVIKIKGDVIKLIDRSTGVKGDQRVQVEGKYVATSWNPGINSNTIEFKGVYRRASIELTDGTLISIMPPEHKSSLRSAREVETHQGKLVKVVGYIKLQPDNSIKNSSPSVILTKVDGIWLK